MIRDRELPPLSALVALEAAVRLGGFAPAARILGVSPVAVGRKVRELEAWCGAPLFVGGRPRLSPTEDARALARATRDGFGHIREALAAIERRRVDANTVTLFVSTAFSLFWLSPRQYRFHAAHPEIALNIVTHYRSDDRDFSGCDLGVVYTRAEWPGFDCVELFRDRLAPAARPDLAARASRSDDKSGLGDLPRLELSTSDDLRPDWTQWLARRGLETSSSGQHRVFNDFGLLVHAALNGEGVCIAWTGMLSDLIASKRLALIEAPRFPTPGAQTLLLNRSAPARRSVAAFRDWLIGEARSCG